MNITIESLDKLCKDFPNTVINIKADNLDAIQQSIQCSNSELDLFQIIRQPDVLILKHANNTVIYFDKLSYFERVKHHAKTLPPDSILSRVDRIKYLIETLRILNDQNSTPQERYKLTVELIQAL